MMLKKQDIHITHQYLNFPIKDGASMRKVRLIFNDQVVRYFDIEWAENEPDFWVFTDVSAFMGERLTLVIGDVEKKHPMEVGTSSTSDADRLEAFIHSVAIEGAENLYREKYRPQFHFTTRRGWNNDPNGLVFYKGNYHMFYQHNPFGRQWGNMHWGHAVSKNLVQWQEFSDVFYPDTMGSIFSGSAIVDWDNTAQLKDGMQDTLICFYTAAGEFAESKVPYTQCMAFSNDSGQTWQKYENNPILPDIASSTRDPKVIWHPESRQWMMALYIGDIRESAEEPHHYALYASPDLKNWNHLQDLYFPGLGECPDFFPLPLNGELENIRWVFWTADGYYRLGKLDGTKFTPETPLLRSTYSEIKKIGYGFAAQTWSDVPAEDGRRIQIAWLVGDLTGMSFNQQMTFPVELSLKTAQDGPRLFSWPVKEIELLYREEKHLDNILISDSVNILPTDGHNLLDIEVLIDVGDADEIELNIRGISLIYEVNKQEVSCLERTIPLKTEDGNIQFRVLLDVASIEIFAAAGLVYLPFSVIHEDHNTTCFLQAKGGTGLAKKISIFKLGSSWE